MKKISIIILTFISITMLAQEKDGDINTRFTKNSLFLFNSFKDGVAYFNDGGIAKAKFNYNIVNNEICYINNNQIFVISNTEELTYVQINNKIFKYINHKIYETVNDGKISILLSRSANVPSENPSGAYGTPSNTSAVTKKTSFYLQIGASGGEHVNFPDEKDETISVKENLYFLIGNDLVLAKRNQIIKKFKSQKSEIINFIEENNFDFQDKNDLIELAAYLERFN
ncbi:MAG: hypothetical protein AB7S50_11590 [Bacteroidales bacterium]